MNDRLTPLQWLGMPLRWLFNTSSWTTLNYFSTFVCFTVLAIIFSHQAAVTGMIHGFGLGVTFPMKMRGSGEIINAPIWPLLIVGFALSVLALSSLLCFLYKAVTKATE